MALPSGMCACLGAAMLLVPAPAIAAGNEAALWRGLAQGDTVALMRHAAAPGYGDPAQFTLDDCATQRNLSAAGRAEARAIGDRMRAHGLADATVRSSQWCRCLETARLLDIGEVIPTAALNSFFAQRSDGEGRTHAIRELLARSQRRQPRVFVTHQVNITALTDVHPASGEIVVVRPADDRLVVVGRIRAPD